MQYSVTRAQGGVFAAFFLPRALPYHLYPNKQKDPHGFYVRVSCEAITLLWAMLLAVPIWKQWRSTKTLGTVNTFFADNAIPCDCICDVVGLGIIAGRRLAAYSLSTNAGAAASYDSNSQYGWTIRYGAGSF